MSVYSVDFDGVCCDDEWPSIGAPHYFTIEWLINLRDCGHKLILNTCREGEKLAQAKAWCACYGLIFDAYNENLPERIAEYGGDCKKVSADFYVDDRAINPDDFVKRGKRWDNL